jgi:uncharacterized protein
MIFVDTGYFFAIANPSDQHYRRAMRWASAYRGQLLTTEYVLWESVNALSRPLDRPQAHILLDTIRLSPEWNVLAATDQLFTAGLAMHRQHMDNEWSLTDCISFFVMRQSSIRSAFAHDHHFEQAGFEALLRRDPP